MWKKYLSRSIPRTNLAIVICLYSALLVTPPSFGDEQSAVAVTDGVRQIASITEAKMVVIPAGEFMMGHAGSGTRHAEPQHKVAVKSFLLSWHEVTLAEWVACMEDGGCTGSGVGDSYLGTDEYWQYHPVAATFQAITNEYIPWLNKVTGKHYRLPTEAEWEYAVRAGSDQKFYWGNEMSGDHANGPQDPISPTFKSNSKWPEDGYDDSTSHVGSFTPNGFGLYDMSGNVSEWTQDCWNDNYVGAPNDGSAWLTGECKRRVIRGGSYISFTSALRSASRASLSEDSYHLTGPVGFRLAHDL